MPRKSTKKEKVEMLTKPVGIPPKPREKLTPGQVLYCWYPPDNVYYKRVYIKEGKDLDWVITVDENGQKWLVNIEHLHNTILTKEEYEKLGQVDK